MFNYNYSVVRGGLPVLPKDEAAIPFLRTTQAAAFYFLDMTCSLAVSPSSKIVILFAKG